ncbi:hypothetical protein ABPG77_000073 [Micractinium sp. CCAP 211/92]
MEEPVRPACGGAWSDYQCINHRAFCLGGYAMDCAAGTVCLGSTRGESPCKWPTGGESPAQTCPNGDGACTGDNTFCSGGLNFTCPGGAVCRAGCCVYQTRERPRLRLCSPCLPGVCVAPWMQAACCALLAMARRKRGARHIARCCNASLPRACFCATAPFCARSR